MHIVEWTVKMSNRKSWGKITRLIINPTTKRIVSADVLLTASGRQLRVPWNKFQIARGRILLREPIIHARMVSPQCTQADLAGVGVQKTSVADYSF